MIYTQMNITELLKAIKARVEADTSLKCHDVPPVNVPAPLVYVELVSIQPADTKTMFCKDYNVYLHVIAEEKASSIPINQYVQDVQEAMTQDITLPEGFELIMQVDNGVNVIKTDESGEKHAVLVYTFRICYGYKMK